MARSKTPSSPYSPPPAKVRAPQGKSKGYAPGPGSGITGKLPGSLGDYVSVMPRHRLLSLLFAPLLAGCSTLESLVPSMPDFGLSDVGSAVGIGAPAFEAAKAPGLAVSDDPFAAQTGAAILSQGGSAADAVSAMFFVLTAT